MSMLIPLVSVSSTETTNTYPSVTSGQKAFFDEHGYLVVTEVIPVADLDELEAHVDRIIENPDRMAFDWAWSDEEDRSERSFRIIQSSPSLVWPGIVDAAFRRWAVEFGSALLGRTVEFWYDQLLAKPPGISVPTYWHQDEGYWGRHLDDKGITCWIPLQDVDVTNGCMHFIDGGHLGGVLEHHRVEGMKSDLLTCGSPEGEVVVCPIARGSVTFHHSKMPHMTTANTGTAYRKAVTQHMQAPEAGGEGDHYPWKVWVNQTTGETIVPETS
jgi:ectoine hydroxylase-related dioxygenase (phytanoyl-CoA dioxygenase family)